MNLRNLNQPRPRWAAATSKLLRVVSISVSAAFFAVGAPTGMLITAVGGAVADFILDLFPNEAEQAAKQEEENKQP